jgi:hypothetical protein
MGTTDKMSFMLVVVMAGVDLCLADHQMRKFIVCQETQFLQEIRPSLLEHLHHNKQNSWKFKSRCGRSWRSSWAGIKDTWVQGIQQRLNHLSARHWLITEFSLADITCSFNGLQIWKVAGWVCRNISIYSKEGFYYTCYKEKDFIIHVIKRTNLYIYILSSLGNRLSEYILLP